MTSDTTNISNRVVDGGAAGGRQIRRIMREIHEFHEENPASMDIFVDENNVTIIHALIRGPDGTPYHNGFFYFVFSFPKEYPMKPPDVKLITTNGTTVRFNPNFYSNGKVCLSILGTWEGPKWSPILTLFSTMISIQTLMNDKPYHNEPGFEEGHASGRSTGQISNDIQNYNKMITHEVIRVAVIGMLEDNSVDARNMPKVLKDVMISFFKNNYRFYEDRVRSLLHLHGQKVIDPYRDPQRPKTFEYKNLLERLLKLKKNHGICDTSSSTAIISPTVAASPSSDQASAQVETIVELPIMTKNDKVDDNSVTNCQKKTMKTIGKFFCAICLLLIVIVLFLQFYK